MLPGGRGSSTPALPPVWAWLGWGCVRAPPPARPSPRRGRGPAPARPPPAPAPPWSGRPSWRSPSSSPGSQAAASPPTAHYYYYYCSTSSILYYHQGRFCLNSGPPVFVYFKISGWENQQEIMLEIAKFFRSLFMIGHILSLADTKTRNLNTSDQVTTAPVRRCRMRGWCGCRRRAARGRPRYRPRRRAAR